MSGKHSHMDHSRVEMDEAISDHFLPANCEHFKLIASYCKAPWSLAMAPTAVLPLDSVRQVWEQGVMLLQSRKAALYPTLGKLSVSPKLLEGTVL